ncbi:MAG: DKNYY domain-containing protein [Myxococcaceae bacterium]|jgi:predicted DNA-binding WGR domain protein|nr:DKNYY domain-containing protein [Myxococcaceae bacterium]
MTKRYFEFSEGSSNKFWEVSLQGTRVVTRYGRIGAPGQTTVKNEGSAEGAKKLYERLLREKTGKGYREKAGASAASPLEGAAKKSSPTGAASARPARTQRESLPLRKVGCFTINGTWFLEHDSDRRYTKGAYQLVDRKTFRLLKTVRAHGDVLEYYADKDRVYFRQYDLVELPGARPDSFEHLKELGARLSRSGGRYYFEGEDITKLVDPKTLRRHPAKDDSGVHFLCDARNVYSAHYRFAKLPHANPKDFEFFEYDGEGFYASGGVVYQNGERVDFDPRDQRSLGGDYAVEGGRVFWMTSHEAKGADAATFEVPYPEQVPFFGRDKNAIFLGGDVMTGVDPKKFEFLRQCLGAEGKRARGGGLYGIDDRRAYFVSVEKPGRFRVLKTKNPKTLTYFVDPKRDSYGFARDDVAEYDGGAATALEQPKAPGLKFVVKDKVVTDGAHFFFVHELPSPKEARKLDLMQRYVLDGAIDGQRVEQIGSKWYVLHRARGLDVKSLTFFSGQWAADRTTVYHSGRAQPRIDRASFEHLVEIDDVNDYAKDKNSVYVSAGTVAKVRLDPATVEVLHPYWAKDKDGLFSLLNRSRIKADPRTFVLHKNGNAEDKLATFVARDGEMLRLSKRK